MLGILKAAGLKLKPSKCDLLKRFVCFLEDMMDGNGVRSDPGKLDAKAKWRRPQEVKDVCIYLGLTDY